ncbi:MAG TPA: hypothetical protein VFW19_09485 [Allosphingosinicella sp.]|nr:hypothetical protein [Allosphingosinicella sp.]
MMDPYWIDKARSLGVGVTARSEADALEIHRVAFGEPETKAGRIPTFADIEQKHVAPNMGNLLKRGIRFPLGYEHIPI